MASSNPLEFSQATYTSHISTCPRIAPPFYTPLTKLGETLPSSQSQSDCMKASLSIDVLRFLAAHICLSIFVAYKNPEPSDLLFSTVCFRLVSESWVSVSRLCSLVFSCCKSCFYTGRVEFRFLCCRQCVCVIRV